MGIEKGTMGKPGLLSGVFTTAPVPYGDMVKNTNEGIFGTVNQQFKSRYQEEPMEIACRQDVKQGPAFYPQQDASGELKDYAIARSKGEL